MPGKPLEDLLAPPCESPGLPGAEPFHLAGDERGCLVVHGFTGTPSEMRPLGDALHKEGYTVMGVRLAGHGTSPADLNTKRWEDWIESVESAWVSLEERCSTIYYAGLSMGGLLGISLARAHPGRFAAMALLSSPLYLPGWKLKLFAPLLRYTPLRWLYRYAPKKSALEPMEPEPGGPVRSSYDRYPVSAIRHLVRGMKAARTALPHLRVPLLIMHSRIDPSIPVANADLMEILAGSPVKRKVILDRSPHVITAGPERERVAREVAGFFARFT